MRRKRRRLDTIDVIRKSDGEPAGAMQYLLWNPETGKKDKFLYLCDGHAEQMKHFEPTPQFRAPYNDCEFCRDGIPV